MFRKKLWKKVKPMGSMTEEQAEKKRRKLPKGYDIIKKSEW